MLFDSCANAASAPSQSLLDSCLQAIVQANAALQAHPHTLRARRKIHRALLVRRLPARDCRGCAVEVRVAVDNQVGCAATSHAPESAEKAPEQSVVAAAAAAAAAKRA